MICYGRSQFWQGVLFWAILELMNCVSLWCTHTQRASGASFTWSIWTGLLAAWCQGCDKRHNASTKNSRKNLFEKKKNCHSKFQVFFFPCCIMLCRISGVRDLSLFTCREKINEEISFSLPSTQKHFPLPAIGWRKSWIELSHFEKKKEKKGKKPVLPSTSSTLISGGGSAGDVKR